MNPIIVIFWKTFLIYIKYVSQDQQNIDSVSNSNEQQKLSSDPNTTQESFISNIEDSYEDSDESSKTIAKEEGIKQIRFFYLKYIFFFLN